MEEPQHIVHPLPDLTPPPKANMNPCVVIDTETTGFPNNGPGFRGRIIEVGAVVITADQRVVSPISFFVKQPENHLRSWQAKKAMGVHGITVNQILLEGLNPSEAAVRFAQWIGKVQAAFQVTEARAYNQAFDFWFLERAPWNFFERTGLVAGEDIKNTAQRAMDSKSGPRLARAVAFANENGGDIEWESAAHRAQEDARMAAQMAVHFAQD